MEHNSCTEFAITSLLGEAHELPGEKTFDDG